MKLNPISFKGIYDIRFPKGTSSEFIDGKLKEAQDFIDKNNTSKGISFVDVRAMDQFDVTRSDKKLEDKGIRVSSVIDNPWLLFELFDSLDKKLGQEYVNQAKAELIFDTQI